MDKSSHENPEFLQAILDAHGGLARFQKINSIEVVFNYSGFVLDTKGHPGHFQPTVTMNTKTPRAVIERLGHDHDSGDRWIYTPDRCWTENHDGTVLETRDNPRAAFAGHDFTTPWDNLHLTYFLGYAFWNYFTTPFDFVRPGYKTRELDSHQESGREWRVLEVTYPPHIPAHCTVQNLYFDADTLLLRRLDYETDVMPGGRGAHYCYDHKQFGGITYPALRRITQRDANDLHDPQLQGPTVFLLDFVDIKMKE